MTPKKWINNMSKFRDWLEKEAARGDFVPLWKTYLFLPYYLWFCRVKTWWVD